MDYASSILGLLPSGRRSIGVTQLLNKLETYLPPAQVDRIRDAYEFGAEAHQGQKRLSGEPYIAHPVAVADLLADLHMDAPTIIAAILHDVIEDTPTAKDEIAERFGADVAELVDGVSKLDHIQFRSRAEAQAESFRKMLLAMVRDIRVIMVKLADRTHNMRTLGSVPPAKRRTVARETLEIYAPIANRLGIHSIKSELEELGFKALYPGRYRIIEKALKRARGNQKQFVGKIADNLRGALEKAGVKAGSRAARSTFTAFIRRCAASVRRWRRSSTCSASASSSTPSTLVTARSAWCTGCTGRCRGASRTTLRSRVSTAINRCTPPCSGRMGFPSKCRSAPRKWSASPSPASPPIGNTRPARTRARPITTARASGCSS